MGSSRFRPTTFSIAGGEKVLSRSPWVGLARGGFDGVWREAPDRDSITTTAKPARYHHNQFCPENLVAEIL